MYVMQVFLSTPRCARAYIKIQRVLLFLSGLSVLLSSHYRENNLYKNQRLITTLSLAACLQIIDQRIYLLS